MKSEYDCIVLGGGPAGCTAAALVAEAGYSTLLLEREKVPRFHVGESLMPESYWTLQRLGVLEQMKRSEFVEKHSVQFISGNGKESQPFFFEEHDDHESSQTWQVERAEFDKMLFDNAAEKGAECHDETRVLDVVFDDGRAVAIKVQTKNGAHRELAANVIMDGTGQQCLIANKLGLKRVIPKLRKAAIWTYFENAERIPGNHGGATLIFQTCSEAAWFWYIPLSKGITSVGLVGDTDFVLRSRPTPEDAFCEELGNCAALAGRLEQAKMVNGYRVAKEFSYTTSQHAGPGWVLIGDAFGFIDPIYSSGVFFALKTGEMAADCVIAGLRDGDLSREALGAWTKSFEEGAQWISKLVDAYYEKRFSFGSFMKQFPMHRGNLTDLLIGRVFHEGAGTIFDDMEPAIAAAQEEGEKEEES